jgi:carbonic anhydrase
MITFNPYQSPFNVPVPTALNGALDLQTNWLPLQAGVFASDYATYGLAVQYIRNMENPSANSSITLDGTGYYLDSFHFHKPGEHVFDGVGRVAELHLVHKNDEDDTAVVIGVPFQISTDPSATFTGVADFVSKSLSGITNFRFPTPYTLLPGAQGVVQCPGSFTTGDYGERVTWILCYEVVYITRETFDLIFPAGTVDHVRQLFPINDRPIQNLQWDGK